MDIDINLKKLKMNELKYICNTYNINSVGKKNNIINQILKLDKSLILNEINKINIKNNTILLNNYINKDLHKFNKNKLIEFSNKNNIDNKSLIKKDIIKDIELFFNHKYENYTIFIQNYFRFYLIKKINKLKGPGLKNRNICNNKTDFFNLQDIHKIPDKYFYSFKDKDNFIYGFEINSIYKMIEYEPINPYNRCKLSNTNINNIIYLYKLISISNKNIEFINNKNLKQEITDAFLYMDKLGNYTNINWFYDLNSQKLQVFYKELEDIWNYRLSLSILQKKQIVYPNGILFTIPQSKINSIFSKNKLRLICIEIIKKLIYSGINIDCKKQGCYYVLMALTIVSNDAANSLPWLANSVLN